MNLNSRKVTATRNDLDCTLSACFGGAITEISEAAIVKVQKAHEKGKAAMLFVRGFDIVGPGVALIPDFKRESPTLIEVRSSIGKSLKHPFIRVSIEPPVEEKTHV